MAKTTQNNIDSMVAGFLAACEFADCASDNEQGLNSADWSDVASADARKYVESWLDILPQHVFDDAERLTIGHQDFGFDNMMSIGSDIYYVMAGHGVGFSDRQEYDCVLGLSDGLTKPREYIKALEVYLGDDGFRYFS